MKKRDLVGQKFNYLTVVRDSGIREQKGVVWECKCDCGNTKLVRGGKLISGEIKSCGCMHYKYGHGKTDTRLYHIWCTMKARCYRPSSHKYKRYGGRGIRMCEEWKNAFMSFYSWAVSNGYEENLSIDRVDNDGDYCPENCRWVTTETQSNNTSTNRIIEFNGERDTLSRMSRKYSKSPSIVWKRLKRGWSVEKALTVD